MDWIELCGYLASLLVFATFYMKTMIPLRAVAIASNIAFMAYGLGQGIHPIVILHALLLPLNCGRLLQMRALVKQVGDASRGDLSMRWLIPYVRRRTARAGDVIFRKGEPAKEMYLVLAGSIRVADIGVTLGPGAVLGEIGIFAPSGQRMDTAVCETPVELGVIEHDKIVQLYYQNPEFGFSLIRLVIQRLEDDYARLRQAPAPPPTEGPPPAPAVARRSPRRRPPGGAGHAGIVHCPAAVPYAAIADEEGTRMAVDRSYVEQNRTQRERLRALVGRLGDQDLSHPMPAGWTVAGVLGHVAFWDQRALDLLEAWMKAGREPQGMSEADVDWINDASKPLLLAVPPRRAAELTLSIAEAVDRAVERLPDDLVARNAAAGNPVNLTRATHRREHHDEIEQVLRR
jgi:CRP-like cAMP-binding protein